MNAQPKTPIPHLELGRVMLTQGTLTMPDEKLMHILGRHKHGDWGQLGDFDCLVNKASLLNQEVQYTPEDPDEACIIQPTNRIFSAYDWDGDKVYVITEPMLDNPDFPRTTTVLLADEY